MPNLSIRGVCSTGLLSRAACAVLGAAAVAACQDGPPPALAPGEVVRFADGTAVADVAVAPTPVDPNAPVRVSFRTDGPPAAFRLGLVPASTGSRQVARGGPNPPPWTVPVDPRSVLVDFVGTGLAEHTLELPAPWHPALVMLTLERVDNRGFADDRIPAVAGPRTQAGVAVLDLVDVRRTPTHVAAPHVRETSLDGVLDEPVWAAATAFTLVASLDGEPLRGESSQVQFAWSDEALLVAARLPDTDLRSTFTARDEPLWKEEAFELFVFGDATLSDAQLRQDARYLELQVSPRGVKFDAAFERYRRGDEGWDGTWRSAVRAVGTIDDPSDVDTGFFVELSVPWAEVCARTQVACGAGLGRQVRVNAFRLERPREGGTIGMALSPTLVPDFHDPRNAAVVELVE